MPALLKRMKKIGWKLVPPRFQEHRERLTDFVGKMGLEIGGPSASFKSRGIFPVYPIAGGIDNCIFGAQTVWDGQWREFSWGKRFVSEATELKFADSSSYDFVLSSHVLEHTANPLKALKEWLRVLKRDGKLFLVVPERSETFDHRRPVTSFEHLLSDYESGRDESDLTHLDEILTLHDLSRDRQAGTLDEFRERSLRNAENRCLHHHVFDGPLIERLLEYTGFSPLHVQFVPPYHIAALAQPSNRSQRKLDDTSSAMPAEAHGTRS